MPLRSPRPHVAAVVFDLDQVLLRRAPAWQYTLEQAVMTVCGRRVDVGPIAGEYQVRPWRDALAILLEDAGQRVRCESLCHTIFARSAMKKLTVFEGVGMALDHLRGRSVEVGAITREPHAVAIKQVQSTGLDRFLSVLSATPAAAAWAVEARLADCLDFLECPPGAAAYVAADPFDLALAARLGIAGWAAGWAGPVDGGGRPLIARAADMADRLR